MTDPLGEDTRPLTPEQAAERWDCSKQLVIRLCQEGKLRHFRIGKLYRITPAAVAEFEAQPAIPPSKSETATRHARSIK
jgi:excisionase family DNA binding protein